MLLRSLRKIGEMTTTPRREEAVSTSTRVALLIVFALGGCQSDGDDDTFNGDYDVLESLDSFYPSVVVHGSSLPFSAEGYFCDESGIQFSESTPDGYRYVDADIMFASNEIILGTIPDGLRIGVYNIWTDCSYGWADDIEDGLRVVSGSDPTP